MDEETTTEHQKTAETNHPTDEEATSDDRASEPEELSVPQDNYNRLAQFLRQTGDTISKYSRHIYGLSTILALALAVLDIFFKSLLESISSTLVSGAIAAMTSNATIVTLLLVVILLQVYLIRTRQTDDQDLEDVRTDGGSDLPPRDSQGRFKSKSGGPDLLMLMLAALAGFTAGSQFGDTEAFIGALLAIALITYLGN
jgi:hypothetical protein